MRSPSVLVLVALSVVLVSCSGGSDGEESFPARQPTTATGLLVVSVTDPDGKPLSNARMTVCCLPGTLVRRTAESGSNGVATIDGLPDVVSISVSHPLGFYSNQRLDVAQAASTALRVVIQPASPITVALLSAFVPAESVSADRTEIDLHVTIVASALSRFAPSGYGNGNPTSPPTPLLRLRDCSVWLDSSRRTPACDWKGAKDAVVLEYAYDPVGTPAVTAAQEQLSTLLLLEQSRRATEYDPYGLRAFAAKRFIRRARNVPQADLIAIAGFAGQGGDTSSPPLIERLPLWVVPNSATVFSDDRFTQEAALDSLQPLIGGNAPVLEALRAAFTLVDADAPGTGRRGVVAVLGGDDDSGLSESQRRDAFASLKRLRLDTGIQPILIASRLNENSAQHRALTEVAAALRAPLIYAGYPGLESYRDGLYVALDLAADLLAGSALPTIRAVFRMKSDQPGGFQSDSVLHGTLYVESDLCSFGCLELPLHFATDIP